MLDFSSRLAKYQLGAFATSSFANFLLFIGTITPAWQVADDLDANRHVESGLWLYCPGASQCWYIFSDDAINYYEKTEVCRFLLIGDCRKKLLRTPYFFGWHYAVLILNAFTIAFTTVAVAAAAYAYFKPARARLAVIVYDVFSFAAAIFLAISLIVFMTNAEMLESKYLIGIKNTFEKSYGYSFYLAGFAFLVLTFSLMFAVLLTTYTFFFADRDEGIREERQYRQSQLQIQTNNSKFNTPAPPSLASYAVSLPPLNTTHGSYIPSARSPTGQFVPETRHFYSYQ